MDSEPPTTWNINLEERPLRSLESKQRYLQEIKKQHLELPGVKALYEVRDTFDDHFIHDQNLNLFFLDEEDSGAIFMSQFEAWCRLPLDETHFEEPDIPRIYKWLNEFFKIKLFVVRDQTVLTFIQDSKDSWNPTLLKLLVRTSEYVTYVTKTRTVQWINQVKKNLTKDHASFMAIEAHVKKIIVHIHATDCHLPVVIKLITLSNLFKEQGMIWSDEALLFINFLENVFDHAATQLEIMNLQFEHLIEHYSYPFYFCKFTHVTEPVTNKNLDS